MRAGRGGLSYLLVAGRETGLVLLERTFPGSSSGQELLAWRAAAFSLTQPCLPLAREQEEHVASHEGNAVVWFATAEVLIFVAGAGAGVDELSLSALARGVLASLQAATYKSGSPGSLAALLESPAGLSRAAVLLDELAPQGVPETTDPDTLHSGVSLTVPVSDS